MEKWKSFMVYYGYGMQDWLRQYDLLILEEKAHQDAFIKDLALTGKTPIAYLTGFEYPPYLKGAEKLWQNNGLQLPIDWKPDWTNNYLMDLRRPTWINYLLNQAETLIERGYQGFFLDTIGVCQMPSLDVIHPGLIDELIIAAAGLVQQLRKNFPDAIIIQNCGLNRLKLLTAPYINGICWEDFSINLVTGKHPDLWSCLRIKELEAMAYDHNLAVLLLAKVKATDGYATNIKTKPHTTAREYAQKCGFLYTVAPEDYASGIYDVSGHWQSSMT